MLIKNIQIWLLYNPGSFASRYNVKDYVKKNIQSNLRNELIAKVLYLSKNIERFGSGLKRIDRLCKENGIKYDYENAKNGFTFIIYRNVQKKVHLKMIIIKKCWIKRK